MKNSEKSFRENINNSKNSIKLLREEIQSKPNITLDVSQNYYGTVDLNNSNFGRRKL